MKRSIKPITGKWDFGYVLDKHVLSSVYCGHNAYGRPQFNTTRSEVGEALFKLKYRGDWTQVPYLASVLASSVYPKYKDVGLLISMPASNTRPRQPVTELTIALGQLVNVPVFDNLIIKQPNSQQLKDLHTKEEKLEALKNSFSVQDVIEGDGPWNALLIDDLFDTGASLQAACTVLRTYKKISRLYVAALTWK